MSIYEELLPLKDDYVAFNTAMQKICKERGLEYLKDIKEDKSLHLLILSVYKIECKRTKEGSS